MTTDDLLYPPSLTDEHLDWIACVYGIDVVKHRAVLQHVFTMGRCSAWKEANAQIKAAFQPAQTIAGKY